MDHTRMEGSRKFIDEFFYERNIEDEPFCPWSFYRVICVYVQSPPLPLAFVIGKVWEIERLQIARARVLQWRASSESHVRSSELHRRPRYTRIHLRGATFIFCYRELYLDGESQDWKIPDKNVTLRFPHSPNALEREIRALLRVFLQFWSNSVYIMVL